MTKAVARVAVPVITGTLLLIHPADPVRAEHLADLLPRWLTVHVGLLVTLPLLALLIRGLIRGLPGRAAKVAEMSLVPGVVRRPAGPEARRTDSGVRRTSTLR